MSFEFACRVSDLPEAGRIIGLEVAGEPVAIARDTDGELYAINDICTHQYVKLSEAETVSNCEVECYLHSARFNLKNGAALCLPAVDPVATYAVSIVGEDVMVDVTTSLNDI